MKYLDVEEYYTAPSDEIFEDIKKAAITIWKEYDDTYGYATEKVNRIKDIPNVSDNWAYMIAMFDHWNQNKLYKKVKREDTQELINRLLALTRNYDMP